MVPAGVHVPLNKRYGYPKHVFFTYGFDIYSNNPEIEVKWVHMPYFERVDAMCLWWHGHEMTGMSN